MAAVITLHSVRLATNPNGALLLTWLLDTCNFPNRFNTLAPRLVSHLPKLCTHKLASLTVLKIINQRSDPEGRDIVLNTLFQLDEENKVLKRILEDPSQGATVIFKILTSPSVNDQSSTERRGQIITAVRNMLQRLKVQQNQSYKRLIDEVGLTDRSVPTPPLLNGQRGPPRSTTPRDYGALNVYSPAAYYPQHNYPAAQQYLPQQQIDMLSRSGQIDGSLLMDMQGSQQIYSQQSLPNHHPQHQDSAQAAYQYQHMLMLQQRSYTGYPAGQQSHQPIYQPPPASGQNQYGGPVMGNQNPPGPGMGPYGANGSSGYPHYPPGDSYRHRPPR
jgi:hypothetical protein